MYCHRILTPRTRILLALIFALVLACPTAYAKGKKGKHSNHKGGHHRSGGHHHFGFGPGGLSYGYHSRGFGIDIGPSYGGYDGYGGPGYYREPSYYRGPSYYPGPSYRADPYYDRSYGAYDNAPHYSQTQQIAEPAAVIATNAKAAPYQQRAELSFRQRRYDDAARYTRHASIEDDTNGKVLLFASQARFAVGDYAGAAAAIRQGMSLLDRAEWGFVVENYKKFYTNDDYVKQMERLVAALKDNPNLADARLVRGYHYAFLGHHDAARSQLEKAIALVHDDLAAHDLLAMVTGPRPTTLDAEELPTPRTAEVVSETDESADLGEQGSSGDVADAETR